VLFAVGIAVVLSAPLSFLIPPGEAPDEPAHVLYLDHIVRHKTLPPVGVPTQDLAYESYQPPLAYMVMAAPLLLIGVEQIGFPFSPDPAFAFQRNRRAFLPAPSSEHVKAARRALYVARLTNLFWLALASGAILVTCLQLTSSPWVAFGAGVPFALAPQLLFTASTIGNDAAVTALVAATTACLVFMINTTDARPALGVSTLAGLALWAKVSAVVVAPAIGLALIWLVYARRWRIVLSLLLPGLVISTGWLILEFIRTGTVFPNPPTGWSGGAGVLRIFAEPRWVLSAWGGFWAKFGWFNIPLPRPAYLIFVPPTLAVLLGLYLTCRSRSASKVGVVLAVIATANVLLLVSYMVRIDWQPQGRYLLPSSAALAGLAVLGLDRICSAIRSDSVMIIALSSGLLSVLAAVGTIVFIAAVY